MPSVMVLTQAAASSDPAAPKEWPIIDLVELMGMLYARSPNNLLMATLSRVSFKGVDVPWALM